MALASTRDRMVATPQVELARTQAKEKLIDILRSKDHLQGVYIHKQIAQTGQKPCCRINMDIITLGNKLVVYGGAATGVYNDVRIVDLHDYQWKVLKQDGESLDFKARFGHSCNGFERYVIIFGGCGPYQAKLKKRSCFQETIAFDIETGKYCKFDGSKASLQAEISEMKTKNMKALNATNESIMG